MEKSRAHTGRSGTGQIWNTVGSTTFHAKKFDFILDCLGAPEDVHREWHDQVGILERTPLLPVLGWIIGREDSRQAEKLTEWQMLKNQTKAAAKDCQGTTRLYRSVVLNRVTLPLVGILIFVEAFFCHNDWRELLTCSV